jgi:hypothetical protein
MIPNLRRVRTTRNSSFLKDMSHHKSSWVRFTLAFNDHAPASLLKQMIGDQNGLVRYKVALLLADMYEHKKIGLSERQLAKIASALETNSNSFAVLRRIRAIKQRRQK